ncbi:MAG: GGDEF domain-containing protein [Candidatus Omnitrophica bacterium]|nr:GGDEF domain-containing protein [Candidatus Omnitrophota bacterium]
MVAVIGLWVVAMIAGLCWARWAVAALTGLAALAALLVKWPALSQPVGWVQLAAFVGTPWLLAIQRGTFERQVKEIRVAEATQLKALQGIIRDSVEMQAWIRETEGGIARITDLYHVTKETARALRVPDLFAFAVNILPRLLRASGLRLIDLSLSGDAPVVLRARQTPDGRLVAEEVEGILPVEQAIIASAAQTSGVVSADAGTLGCELPAGVSRVAWTPLWSEQTLLGVAAADDLPADQVETLAIVANQLSLQLARVHLYQQVESMAITDTLTGLFVRRYFLELATEELLRAKRHHLPCAFLMADLDFFKAKNDTYGHLTGDVVLREVAQLLRKNLRGIDLIARYGGEEFILLLVESDPEQARLVAERLRQLVEIHPIRAYDELLSQTISVGTACYPEDGQELQELIDRADHALYAAKRAGRNRALRWSPTSSRLKAEGSREETGRLEPRT